ncbi:Diphthine methyltransferase [Ordospora colligata]|uniref:WD40 domain-containing protein n=1 Tax=Ordospora colligata OC4 TaxID=1354746 RepID=A0A0B2UK07_9MICR|nr:uncharacterized protein M896_080190 [Ordospora colligata OC4]KHN69285.1 hypothetical protein M896_080190 [Ordospora colligata OC4]TBU15101.1 hypothetical protein CWI41_080200 [Ordospora colligata]TBU15152.1 hypothetical protein CWI40_080200 [Ordospora colligata]
MKSFDSIMPIDCLCIVDDILIAGGYQFTEASRSGGVYLYDIYSMQIKNEFETTGILDCKKNEEMVFFAGCEEFGAICLKNSAIDKICTPAINTYVCVNSSSVFVCDIMGHIRQFEGYGLVNSRDTIIGEEPIWVVEAYGDSIACGSEDGMLRFIDTRSWSVHQEIKRKSGVTSIYHTENYTYVGSYDEHIEIVDRRKYDIIERKYVGGGVWRICYFDGKYFVACMYEGLKVYGDDFSLLKHYATESIAYGLALSHDMVAFASFYDKKIHKIEFEDIKSID